MLTLDEALDRILAQIQPKPHVPLPLLDSLGFVLADDVFADIDMPPFDNSAVDGYAVRAVDTLNASPENSKELRQLGEVAAGQVASEGVSDGTCIKVLTGAPIPTGADEMVMK